MLGSVWGFLLLCWLEAEDSEDYHLSLSLSVFHYSILILSDIYVFLFHCLLETLLYLLSSFMNYYYDIVVIPLHYSVTLYLLWFCDGSHLYIYTPLMIRVLYYLSWYVCIIVNLNSTKHESLMEYIYINENHHRITKDTM